MSGDDLKLNLRLTADGKGFVGEVRMSKRELDKLTGATRTATAETGKSTSATRRATAETRKNTTAASGNAEAKRRAGRAAAEYNRATKQSTKATRGFGESLIKAHGRIIGYVGGIGGITLATRGLVRHADSYTQISNAVRLATDAGASHAAIQSEIFDIAHRTRAPVAELSNLFQQLSISSADLGASNEQFLRVLEGVGQALVINGTVADRLEWERGGLGGFRGEGQ